MLNKYKKLLDMLEVEGYKVEKFINYPPYNDNAIVYNNNNSFKCFDITFCHDGIEVSLYNKKSDTYQEIKKYKNVKSAYNYITKHLGFAIRLTYWSED